MSSTPTEPRDKLGHLIEVGSFIVYGHALGRSAGLRIGRVLGLTWHGGGGEADYYGQPGWHIRVQGVDDDWGPNVEPRLCKPGTLMFPERVILVYVGDLPEAIRDLLVLQ